MSCSSAPVIATSRSTSGKAPAAALTAWATETVWSSSPWAVGLVVVLRRRRDPEAQPELRVGGEDPLEQPRAAAGSGSSPPARAAPPRARSAETGGPSARSSCSYSPSLGGADRADRDLGPVLGVDREAAVDEDDGAGGAALEAARRRPPRRPPRPSRCGRRPRGGGSRRRCGGVRRSRSRTQNAAATDSPSASSRMKVRISGTATGAASERCLQRLDPTLATHRSQVR